MSVLDAGDAVFRRAEVLSPEASPLIDRLRLRALLDGTPAVSRPCRGIATWWRAGVSPERRYFRGRRGGGGWLLNRHLFNYALGARARRLGVQWCPNHRASRIERDRLGWRVTAITTAQGEVVLTAGFLVDASGRRAAGARAAGAKLLQRDRLVALAANFEPSSFEDAGWLRVEAVPEGWWYSAVMPSGEGSVVLVTDAASARRMQLQFNEALQRAKVTIARAGVLVHPSLHAVAAGSRRLDAVAGEGWIAVGDAATTFDPLASQGLFSALASGYFGALATAATLSGDGGASRAYEASLLAAYESTLAQTSQVYALVCSTLEQSPFWSQRRRTGA